MGKASRARADQHRERGISLPSKPQLALDRAVRRACSAARLPDRIKEVKRALHSPFFEKAFQTALEKLHVKPRTLDETREVMLSVLRESFGCDTRDVVIKLELERFIDAAGERIEQVKVPKKGVFAHPRLILPVVERFKREGRL